ncbi:hypothetical protein EBU71_22920, partial [bacterium]|nr:hypothetical protein [Candidatus Elulimicrobium humile]
VRHVHIFEPLLTFAADKQTIGRAARYCSHSDLNIEQGEWTVKVHRYISDFPEDLSQFNLNYLQDRTKYFIEYIEQLQDKLDSQSNTSNSKAKREGIKEHIKEVKNMIQVLQKKHRDIEKMNLKNVEMIDAKISKEAFARAQEMMILYDAMKKAAIDYLLFKDFHNNSFV